VNCLFELRDAGVSYGAADVLQAVSAKLHSHEFVAIAGPNGAGKSTLISLLAGLAAPSRGECLFLGRKAHLWNRREFARRVALVEQTEAGAFPFTAQAIIAMGRMPYSAGIYETAEDHAAVARAIAATETEAFCKRDFRTLSGGEKQRVLLASALAQEPEVLLLDEPSNHLDLRHQLALHRLLREQSRTGLLVVSVTHDLNLAAAYADRMILIDGGRIRADGPPERILEPDLVSGVFHVRVELHRASSGQPWLVYGE
jgi:iron complex transport system ATP-binding protein